VNRRNTLVLGALLLLLLAALTMSTMLLLKLSKQVRRQRGLPGFEPEMEAVQASVEQTGQREIAASASNAEPTLAAAASSIVVSELELGQSPVSFVGKANTELQEEEPGLASDSAQEGASGAERPAGAPDEAQSLI
jgi:hypothetical protein